MRKPILLVLCWIIAVEAILLSALVAALMFDMPFRQCLWVSNVTTIITSTTVYISARLLARWWE